MFLVHLGHHKRRLRSIGREAGVGNIIEAIIIFGRHATRRLSQQAGNENQAGQYWKQTHRVEVL